MAARLRVLASTQQLCLLPGPGNRTPVNKRPLCAGRGPRPGSESPREGPHVRLALLSRGAPSGLGEHVKAVPGMTLLERAQGATDALRAQVCATEQRRGGRQQMWA